MFSINKNLLKKKSLNFKNKTTFVDLETKSEIKTDPWQIRNNYEKLLEDLKKYYSNQFNKNHIDYVPLTTKQSLDMALTEYLRKKNSFKLTSFSISLFYI